MARPDRLLLGFTVAAISRSIDEAMTDVAARTSRLDTVLDELAIPPEARATTGLTAHRELPWENGTQVDKGFRATHSLHLRLDSADQVGELVRRAIAEAAAWVTGPSWTIGPGHPAYLEACRLAAEDAHHRAEAFATALGARLGPVLAAAEPATRTGAGADFGYAPMALRSAKGPEQDAVNVQPGELEVTATVDVSFSLDA